MINPKPDHPLDALRREIDIIDDAMVDLLLRRFAATAKVRAAKSQDGSIASSPFRPAREATMLRRLLARAGTGVPPDLVVRLWRVILSASTQSQARITLHVDRALGEDIPSRVVIAENFPGMEVRLHSDMGDAFLAVGQTHGDLAILSTTSGWAEPFAAGAAGGATVIGRLPVTGTDGAPPFLVFGHAEPQPSGDDETLIVGHPAQSGLSHLWQAQSGTWSLTSLPGFLEEDSQQLRHIRSAFPGIRIAGRYPRPLKVFP
jgi:chorismate mutase